MNATSRPLALTMGDPAGIGPEISLAVWAHRHTNRCPPFALLADPALLEDRAREVGLLASIAEVGSFDEAGQAFDKALPVMPVKLAERVRAGAPKASNGAAVIGAIEAGVAAVADGSAAALVTNPIAKSVLYEAGFRHPGHTEFLAELAVRSWPAAAATPVMMLASDVLRVVPLTIHVPLAAVPGMMSTNLIAETARIMAAALRTDFGVARPRIAVAGLNPHAGEGGSIGTEDRDVIAPAIAKLQSEGLDIRGPLSADTLFHTEARATYDAVLAMYHDQALIPIKTLSFDTGVNVTLGLPFVRTSPDHGTAFDIAGRGKASPRSLLAALRMAADMSSRRAAARAKP